MLQRTGMLRARTGNRCKYHKWVSPAAKWRLATTAANSGNAAVRLEPVSDECVRNQGTHTIMQFKPQAASRPA